MVGLPDKQQLLLMQREQFAHDRRNHSDVVFLGKVDRLKHYGLHYAKYVGRLVRPGEPIGLPRTIVDTVLVCLSAANTLGQNLGVVELSDPAGDYVIDRFSDLADAAGRFADACEKTDHVEPFIDLIRQANLDIMSWALRTVREEGLDLVSLIEQRRAELGDRAFFAKNLD